MAEDFAPKGLIESSSMNVLMISGDVHVIQNIDGPFSLTLTELSKDWTHIDVLCPGKTGLYRRFKDNVELFGVRKFLLAFDLFNLLKKKKYDLVVTHDYGLMLNGLSAYFALKVFRIPQVSEIHHIEGFPIAVSLKEKFYAFWGKLYVRFFARYFAAIRVDNMGQIVQLLKSLGVSPKKIIYLPPIYLELEKYRPLPIKKMCDVLFVGRLVDNKGIFTIVKAIKKLIDQGIFFKTVIKGRGPLETQIRQFIECNGLQNFVSIDQRILDEEELIELYNQTKVLVCASTVEGGPRVTLEAMACGIPVISTPCGLMPEVLIDGQNGFLFDGSVDDLVQKLKALLSESKAFEAIEKQSRSSVLPYDYQITLKNYAVAYKNLIQF